MLVMIEANKAIINVKTIMVNDIKVEVLVIYDVDNCR